MRFLALASVLFLMACEDPRLNIGASIGTDGIRVSPSVSARSGNATISVRP